MAARCVCVEKVDNYKSDLREREEKLNTVEPSVATISVSDHLFSATSFPKYQKCPSQITIFGTSCLTQLIIVVNSTQKLETTHLAHTNPLPLSRQAIGLKNSRHFVIQSEVKPKPFTLSCDWSSTLSVYFVIG